MLLDTDWEGEGEVRGDAVLDPVPVKRTEALTVPVSAADMEGQPEADLLLLADTTPVPDTVPLARVEGDMEKEPLCELHAEVDARVEGEGVLLEFALPEAMEPVGLPVMPVEAVMERVTAADALKVALMQGVGEDTGDTEGDTVPFTELEPRGEGEGVTELDVVMDPDSVELGLPQEDTEGLRDTVPLAVLQRVSVRVAVPLMEKAVLIVGSTEGEAGELALGTIVALSVGYEGKAVMEEDGEPVMEVVLLGRGGPDLVLD